MRHRSRTTRRELLATASIAAGMLVAGCSTPPPQSQRVGEGLIEPESAIRASDYAWLAQTAEGARQDGTLHEMHFDDQALNSLGQNKLLLAAQAAGTERPLRIHLVAAASDARRESVRAFLASAGVSEGRWAMEDGPSQETLTPAAAGLAAEVRMREDEAATAPPAARDGSFRPSN